jgi:hypothetical protein
MLGGYGGRIGVTFLFSKEAKQQISQFVYIRVVATLTTPSPSHHPISSFAL